MDASTWKSVPFFGGGVAVLAGSFHFRRVVSVLSPPAAVRGWYLADGGRLGSMISCRSKVQLQILPSHRAALRPPVSGGQSAAWRPKGDTAYHHRGDDILGGFAHEPQVVGPHAGNSHASHSGGGRHRKPQRQVPQCSVALEAAWPLICQVDHTVHMPQTPSSACASSTNLSKCTLASVYLPPAPAC